MVDLEMAEQETADPATVDLATADPETADPATVDLAKTDPETADPETADLAMAVPATVDPVTVDLETETVDLSTEQAFFASATVLSDHPVSFDTESRWPTLDLEGREQRRAQFTRVVGVIIGALSVVALVAATRPGPTPAEPAPFVASSPIIAEVPEVAETDPNQPTPTVLPELSVNVPAASSSVEPGSASAPSASAPSASAPLASAPAASVARPRTSAPQAPVATRPAPSDKRPPPAARFAD